MNSLRSSRFSTFRTPRTVWRSIITLALCATAASYAGDGIQPMQSSIARVDRELLLGFLADNSTMALIDARSSEEFSAQHLPGAINVPFDAVDAHSEFLPRDKNLPVVVYCSSGKRAALLKSELLVRGFTNVQVLPREQIFWEENFMVFNCGVDPALTETSTTATVESNAPDP